MLSNGKSPVCAGRMGLGDSFGLLTAGFGAPLCPMGVLRGGCSGE